MAEKQCSSSGCTKESCEGCPSKNKPTSFQVASNEYTKVKHVIGVVSGKGGVGKSMVTASLANMMAEKGYRVGILDADITGPSIPKMYGLHGPAQADDNGIYPLLAENDIKIMSINLLMPDEEAPVIWRGPVISGMVKQFWTDVIWGELDYLFVDMPPGTGDIQITLSQKLDFAGAVIVSTPQDIALIDAVKGVNMFKKVNVPILGIVENMSYYICEHCGARADIFGHEGARKTAEKLGETFLGEIPLHIAIRENSDAGTPVVYSMPGSAYANAYLAVARQIKEKLGF